MLDVRIAVPLFEWASEDIYINMEIGVSIGTYDDEWIEQQQHALDRISRPNKKRPLFGNFFRFIIDFHEISGYVLLFYSFGKLR